MFSHVVLYKTYPANPNAAESIVRQARELLSGATRFGCLQMHAGLVVPAERVVSGQEYQVMLNFVFFNRNYFLNYMGHPEHAQFVRFVLRGWMLKGSKARDPEGEFIFHILKAGPEAAGAERVRNPLIPDNEVVWLDELVIDAGE